MITLLPNEVSKIDSKTVDGLLGVNNSVAYKVHEIEKHFHSGETWLGIRAVPDATDWGIDTSIDAFQAISGADAYGADANDEAEVIGTGDLPILSGGVKFDLHRLFIVDVSQDSIYKLRIVYGTGTMADAITAGQYSEVVVISDATNPQQSTGGPVDVMMPRKTSGTDKIWIQAWNATDNATIDFLVGLHEYVG